jgi:branched-chain amino acid transport system permease protein
MGNWRKRKNYLFVGIFLLFLFVPLFLRGYWIRLLTNMFMFAVLAESVNIIAGYCGYLALGNMFFFGLGAYTVAVLMTKFSFPFYCSLLIAGFGASFFAMVVGLPILRLKGQYFLMATVGLLELLREITTNLSLTGGGQGITLPIFPGGASAANYFFYYYMFFLMILSILCTFYISKSHFGFAFRAIKFDEDAASVIGINPTPYKTLAWSISAFFTALTGGGYAYWMTYIDPGEVYQIMPSVKMYLMMVLGGAGTVLGPIAGAFFIELISELVWGKFLELHLLILGLVLVLVVIFTPKGFIDLIHKGLSPSKLLLGIKANKV